MSKGTLIICSSINDTLETMVELEKAGIKTDFKYDVHGFNYVLEVVEDYGKR